MQTESILVNINADMLLIMVMSTAKSFPEPPTLDPAHLPYSLRCGRRRAHADDL